MTKSTDENKLIEKIDSPWELIGYIFKYRAKSLCAVLTIIIVGTILILNVSYDEKHGFRWRPAAKITIDKELKK